MGWLGRLRLKRLISFLSCMGVDEFLSIKRSVSIPLQHVVSVSTERLSWQSFRQMKIAGASIPDVVKDGRFLSSDGMMFFEMHDADKCVTVSLDYERCKKTVFEVEDKEATTKKIKEATKLK
jgi:hypothetical protein